jgi:hypothetical protein
MRGTVWTDYQAPSAEPRGARRKAHAFDARELITLARDRGELLPIAAMQYQHVMHRDVGRC